MSAFFVIHASLHTLKYAVIQTVLASKFYTNILALDRVSTSNTIKCKSSAVTLTFIMLLMFLLCQKVLIVVTFCPIQKEIHFCYIFFLLFLMYENDGGQNIHMTVHLMCHVPSLTLKEKCSHIVSFI